MNILFIGDPHIRPDNTEEVDILIHEIERVCRDASRPFDMIVIGGDVMHYHERVFTPALNKALEFIDKMRTIAPTYVLVGNHDAINNSIFLTEHHWMNALKKWENVYIVDNIIVKGDIILCPYVPPGRLIEAIETSLPRDEWVNKKIIFAHQEIKGCRMGAIMSEHGDEWKDKYPVLISGHIHDHQKVGENVYYPGTPLQHSFGDSDVRVVTSIVINNDNDYDDIKPVFLPLRVPVKKIVKSTLKDLTTFLSKMENVDKNIKVKLDTTTVEFSAFKQTTQYKDLVKQGVKFQLKPQTKKYNNNDDENKENEENDEDEENDNKNEDFSTILKELVKNDSKLVNDIYHELFVNELIL